MSVSTDCPRQALKFASAAGTDAGNRNAKRNGRNAWNADDLEAACEASDAVLRSLGFHWLVRA